jgi:hypothetical protein
VSVSHREAGEGSPALLQALETAILEAARAIGCWAPITQIMREAHVLLDPVTRSLLADMIFRRVLLEQRITRHAAIYRAAPPEGS